MAVWTRAKSPAAGKCGARIFIRAITCPARNSNRHKSYDDLVSMSCSRDDSSALGADLGAAESTSRSPISGDSSMLAKKLPQKPNLWFRPRNATIRLPTRNAKNNCIIASPIVAFDDHRTTLRAASFRRIPAWLRRQILVGIEQNSVDPVHVFQKVGTSQIPAETTALGFHDVFC